MTSHPGASPSVFDGSRRAPNRIATILQRRWRWIAIAALISALVAGGAAWKLGKQEWTYTGTLIFSHSAVGAPYYISPDIRTQVSFIKSRDSLEELARDFQLAVPVSALAKLIDAEVPSGSDSIVVSLRWGDERQAQQMLDRLMALFIDHIEENRKQAVGRYVVDFGRSLDLSKQRVVETKDAANRFNREHRVVDVETDLAQVKDELASIELAMENSKVKRRNLEAQLARLSLLTSDAPPEDAAPATGNPKLDAPAGSEKSSAAATGDSPGIGKAGPIADAARPVASADLQRRAILRERILDERQRILEDTELTLKRKEFDRAKALHAKQFISDAEYTRVEAELNAMLAQRSSSVQSLKDQLKRIESRIPSSIASSAEGNLTLDRLADTATTLELELVASHGDMAHLETYYNSKKQELERLTALRPRGRALAEDIEGAVRERQRQEALLAMFNQMLTSDVREFAVSQPAEPDLDPLRNNRLKLFAAVFLACGIALVLPVALGDLLFSETAAEKAARRLGVPYLTVGADRGRALLAPRIDVRQYDDAARLLTLRIQQSIDRPGYAVLFSSLGQSSAPAPLLARLGHCFAARGERVVVVDLAPTNAETGFTGLSIVGDATAITPKHATTTHATTTHTANGNGDHDGARNDDSLAKPSGEQLSGVAISAASAISAMAARARTIAIPESAATTPAAHAAPATALGVADFLADPRRSLDEVVLTTAIAGVDCILPGNAAMPAEAFAARRTSEFFDALRQRYSVILLAGPRAVKAVDLEMLTARVDSVVFTALGRRATSEAAEQTARELIDLGAPVLGVMG